MARRRKELSALAGAAALLGMQGCDSSLEPPTPPLLRDVTAAGGWWDGGCPPRDATDEILHTGREALSPELDSRLRQQFPAGSEARRLVQELRAQGFRATAPCENDASIHHAEFRQSGGGFAGPYPIFASVAWKEDARGRIAWTKASVSFTGP